VNSFFLNPFNSGLAANSRQIMARVLCKRHTNIVWCRKSVDLLFWGVLGRTIFKRDDLCRLKMTHPEIFAGPRRTALIPYFKNKFRNTERWHNGL
jgi:hypothetical protein